MWTSSKAVGVELIGHLPLVAWPRVPFGAGTAELRRVRIPKVEPVAVSRSGIFRPLWTT
ncbi:hypothetical protein GCM10009533_21870 [Saccharopolyspora spinosporotrichia]